LNRLRLRKPLAAAHAMATNLGQQVGLARLAVERWLSAPKQRRMVTTICWNFPIYSQTFVYQELCSLAEQGFAVRLIYSKLDPRDQLPKPFALLWKAKRRLLLNRKMHARDFAHYRRRMPEKLETLVGKLCSASGLSPQDLMAHGNFLEAFSFTRMVEAYRPAYLHSYFFYDRSLMALIAGYLLDIPRGISSYADHMLKDYELKIVPLHLELCDVVVATSERIKRELMEFAPLADPGRIVVKPNGIDTDTFAELERTEPPEGAPFRLISVCRIEPKKGLLDLVEAVQLLRERGRRVEAHLVGAPDEWSVASREYKEKLDQRITELNLWGTVHLEGRQGLEGVQRLLGLAHLFVAPFVETDSGDKDGIPTALLEGMATGLPAVATDAGSIPEVIEHGHDGLLVPQRNPAALADAIETLLLDPVRRERLGREASAKVRRLFDAGSCAAVFHERVQTLLTERDAGNGGSGSFKRESP
ncbi:MAG TPA: glycosyltransferase, partial [Gemmatimonadales bacterium]|nr:glycosyltransferase [Gemmatimonadales bacterium]